MEAVVFDCDGLLLETESRWTMAEERVCQAHSATFTMELKRQMLGSSIERAGELLAAWVGLGPHDGPRMGNELLLAYRDVIDEHGVQAMPGVARLLEALDGRVPIAVASNTNETDTRRVLAKSGLPSVFQAIVCAGGAIPPKPAPDLYLAACAVMGAEPARSVAFEDSPLGAAAATAAGMYVIGVPSTVGVMLTTHRVLGSMIDITADELVP